MCVKSVMELEKNPPALNNIGIKFIEDLNKELGTTIESPWAAQADAAQGSEASGSTTHSTPNLVQFDRDGGVVGEGRLILETNGFAVNMNVCSERGGVLCTYKIVNMNKNGMTTLKMYDSKGQLCETKDKKVVNAKYLLENYKPGGKVTELVEDWQKDSHLKSSAHIDECLTAAVELVTCELGHNLAFEDTYASIYIAKKPRESVFADKEFAKHKLILPITTNKICKADATKKEAPFQARAGEKKLAPWPHSDLFLLGGRFRMPAFYIFGESERIEFWIFDLSLVPGSPFKPDRSR